MTNALFANVQDRTVKGLLLPFHELSKFSSSSAEPIEIEPGIIRLPRDPSVVTINEAHDRFRPVGRAIELEETEAGIVATFSIANTDEGDEVLAGIASGRLSRLSAEIASLVRRGAKAVGGALTGAAFVEEGAFASAALFAVGDVTEAENKISDADEQPEEESSDNPSEETQTPKENEMTDAVIPDGVEVVNPDSAKADETSANGLFAAISKTNISKDPSFVEAYNQPANAVFSIASIQQSGPSTVTIGADIQVPTFLGELWSGRAFARKFIPLFNSQALTSYKVNGWRWVTKPVVASYAGNNAEVPSGSVDTEPVTKEATRYAGSHRLDRRYIDFPDQDFYESYVRAMVESYARVTDAAALASAVAAATPVEAGAVPSGIAEGLVKIVDGALAVIAAEATPTFAVVSPELWRAIVLTGKNDVLGYLNAGFGLEAGSTEGFTIIPGAVGTDKVLVGAREAMTVHEFGGGAPIRIEGLVPSNGAIDPAVYGYQAEVVHKATALALVGDAEE